ncbi:MAG: D-glycero-beta-D-manno-heptose 1-phosphate adenylyltransferase, partial [Proteobacteria bacterium]|nr:D-glycero-beta-D-manno-heptose 1-phosphate adenylyltransferase [Pseudomonadota bacterium]
LEDKSWDVLGGAANVAANIADFGGSVFLAGRIGNDDVGLKLLKLCGSRKIDCRAVVKSDKCPTIKKLRVMAGYQQVVRIDSESVTNLDSDHEDAILTAFEFFAKESGHKSFVISDYAKGVCSQSMLSKIISLSQKHNIPVVTDPKNVDLKRYAGSTIIKPNLTDGRALFKHLHPDKALSDTKLEPGQICKALVDTGYPRNIVLSLSEKGVLGVGVDFENGEISFSSTVHQVADVSGAGDTMVSFLAMGLAARLPIERVLQLANIASGIVCTKLGTATLNASEFLESFKAQTEETAPEKVLKPHELADLLEQARSSNMKIVFTNGCFDLLHIGHIEILQRSKSFGDILVVALNSDKSVRNLKGPSRPIQTEHDRQKIMASLACVDYVTLFEDETPLNLIKLFKPHVLVKGGDYTEDTIVGAKEVKSWGGKIEIVSLVEGKSTSKIVEKSKIN